MAAKLKQTRFETTTKGNCPACGGRPHLPIREWVVINGRLIQVA